MVDVEEEVAIIIIIQYLPSFNFCERPYTTTLVPTNQQSASAEEERNENDPPVSSTAKKLINDIALYSLWSFSQITIIIQLN